MPLSGDTAKCDPRSAARKCSTRGLPGSMQWCPVRRLAGLKAFAQGQPGWRALVIRQHETKNETGVERRPAASINQGGAALAQENIPLIPATEARGPCAGPRGADTYLPGAAERERRFARSQRSGARARRTNTAYHGNPVTVRVYDFFAGCGGASCGFQAVGMEIAFALDHDADAKASFKANFPNAHFELVDIRKANVQAIQSRVEAEGLKPVLFSGCAPCQPFTKQNTTRPDQDERVPLLDYFSELVEYCLPDIVFVENVPGLQKFDENSQPFGDFLNRLNRAGYEVDYRPITLVKYGVPQSRRRLVLIGSRHGTIFLPDETHGPGTPYGRYTTVRDWIFHLPPIRAGETHGRVANHRSAALSPSATWNASRRRLKAVAIGTGLSISNSIATRAFQVIATFMAGCHGTSQRRDLPHDAQAIRTDASVIRSRTEL